MTTNTPLATRPTPPTGFSLRDEPAILFDSSLPLKEQNRLQEKFARIVKDAARHCALESDISEAYALMDENAVTKIARQMIAPLVPFNCAVCHHCNVSCVVKFALSSPDDDSVAKDKRQDSKANDGNQDNRAFDSTSKQEQEAMVFAKAYIRAALEMRRFTADSPSAAVAKFLEAIIINFYRRHDNDLGIYCPNDTCRDKRDIIFKRVSDLYPAGSDEAQHLLKLLKRELAELPASNSIVVNRSVVTVHDTMESNSDAGSSNEKHDTSAALLDDVIEKENQLPYTPMPDKVAKELPFSRCHYVEILQAPFVVMFVRFTGNEDFINASVACVKSGSVPANVRMMYQCDLNKSRLLSYGEVLKQTQFYIDHRFEPSNIHHFVHPIQAEFNEKFILQNNRTLLQLLQATRRHWAAQLSTPERQVVDAEYQSQKCKQEQQLDKDCKAAKADGLQEYRQRHQAKRMAPTVVDAHRSKVQKDRATKLTHECRRAIRCFADWLWASAADTVRCESIKLENDLTYSVGDILPFVLFVSGYFNLVERNVDVDHVRSAYFEPLKHLFENFWSGELQTLYSIATAQHVAEQSVLQKDMIGFIGSRKPLTLFVSKDLLYALDLFLSLQGNNTTLLRAMLSGTFVTLRCRPADASIDSADARKAKKRNHASFDSRTRLIDVNEDVLSKKQRRNF